MEIDSGMERGVVETGGPGLNGERRLDAETCRPKLNQLDTEQLEKSTRLVLRSKLMQLVPSHYYFTSTDVLPLL